MLSYAKQLQRIAEDYRKAGQEWPATAHDIAGWAIREGRWQPSRSDMISQCADQIARAMREEYIIDPQGRKVRAKHVAREKRDGGQVALWDDIRTADRQHMMLALQQRRQQIVGDCRQLKTDVDSYNENGNKGVPIQIVLDFTEDVAELAALEEREVAPVPLVMV